MRKLGEELREVRELFETEQDKTHGSEEQALQLHNQVRAVGRCVHASETYVNTSNVCQCSCTQIYTHTSDHCTSVNCEFKNVYGR